MEIQLKITERESGASSSPSFALEDRVIVGRDLNSPIGLEGPGISREHFAFVLKDSAVFIQDLSTNGTWLNNKDLPKQNLERVRSGDLIEVPGYELQVRLTDDTSQPVDSAEPSRLISPAAAKPGWLGPVRRVLPSLTWFEMLVVCASLSSFLLIWYYSTN